MTALQRFRTSLSRFETHALHRKGARVFRGVLGGTLLFRAATEFRYAELMWGANGLGTGTQRRAFGDLLGGALDGLLQHSYGPQLLLCVQAIAGLCLLAGLFERIAGLAAWFTMFVLGTRLPEVQDGGDNVAVLVLLFSVMMLPQRATSAGRTLTWIHNVGVCLVWFQICLLYFTAGTMKLAGGYWRDGTALYYISSIRWFSHPAALELFKHAIPATVAAYATMLHQLWFPVAVFTRLRLPWILFGMTFHIGIAVFMGLVTFSCFMIGLELLLISDEDYGRIGIAGRRFCATIRWLGGRVQARLTSWRAGGA